MNKIRKIITVIILASVGMFFVQCKKPVIEQLGEDSSTETIEVSLKADNGSSKAVIDGKKIEWRKGDIIYIVGATDGYRGYVTAQNDGYSAYFTGTINKCTSSQKFHFYFFGSKTVEQVVANLNNSYYYTYDISSQKGTIADIADNLLLMHGESSTTIDINQTNLGDVNIRSMISIVKMQFSISSELSQTLGTKVICIGGASGVKFNIKTGSLEKDGSSTPYRRYKKNVNLTNVGSSDYYMVVIPGKQTLEFSQGIIGKVCTGPDDGFVPHTMYNFSNPKIVVLDKMTYLPALFTVNNGPDGEQGTDDDTRVKFSKGNLQYIGSASPAYWKFATNQYDVLGATTGQDSDATNVDRDLFGWGTSGYHQSTDTYNTNYYPYSTASSGPAQGTNFYGYGPSTNVTPEGPAGMTQTAGNISGSYYDWGIYNTVNVGNTPTTGWRILSDSEWGYLMSRTNLYGHGQVGSTHGWVLLPDEWSLPTGLGFVPGTHAWATNTYTTDQWAEMEAAGAVFFPAAGLRDGTTYRNSQNCYYWTATRYTANAKQARYVDIYSDSEHGNGLKIDNLDRYYALSVRLVRESGSDANGNANPFEPGTW